MDIIKIRGIWVSMLLCITPDVYRTYVDTDSKVTKKLITQCMNVIYGTMVETILYYCKFLKTLKLNKFKMNPYDPYVGNR